MRHELLQKGSGWCWFVSAAADTCQYGPTIRRISCRISRVLCAPPPQPSSRAWSPCAKKPDEDDEEAKQRARQVRTDAALARQLANVSTRQLRSRTRGA